MFSQVCQHDVALVMNGTIGGGGWGRGVCQCWYHPQFS